MRYVDVVFFVDVYKAKISAQWTGNRRWRSLFCSLFRFERSGWLGATGSWQVAAGTAPKWVSHVPILVLLVVSGAHPHPSRLFHHKLAWSGVCDAVSKVSSLLSYLQSPALDGLFAFSTFLLVYSLPRITVSYLPRSSYFQLFVIL
jgi:hypothetical protein